MHKFLVYRFDAKPQKHRIILIDKVPERSGAASLSFERNTVLCEIRYKSLENSTISKKLPAN